MEHNPLNSLPTNPEEKEKLNVLADQVDGLRRGGPDRIIDKLVAALRAGDRKGAIIFCNNEFDKFSQYRETILPLLVTELYGGSGSPWSSIERKMRSES
jgi:hypothetical protein